MVTAALDRRFGFLSGTLFVLGLAWSVARMVTTALQGHARRVQGFASERAPGGGSLPWRPTAK